MNGNNIDRLKVLFNKQGFRVGKFPKLNQLNLKPDLILRKNKDFKLIYYRGEGTSIPDYLVFSIIKLPKISNFRLYVYIVFGTKPTSNIIRDLKTYGIGSYILKPKSLQKFENSKDFSHLKKPTGTHNKTLQSKRIFISSHQETNERVAVKKQINWCNRTYKLPYYPILVEEQPGYSMKRIKKCINDCMDRCQWYLGILAEEYREIVKYELKRACRKFDSEEIYLYVKSSKLCTQNWIGVIGWLKKKNEVKYLNYSSVTDLKMQISNALMEAAKNEARKRKIDF